MLGLLVFGHDGKMATYAAMVVGLRRWRSGGRAFAAADAAAALRRAPRVGDELAAQRVAADLGDAHVDHRADERRGAGEVDDAVALGAAHQLVGVLARRPSTSTRCTVPSRDSLMRVALRLDPRLQPLQAFQLDRLPACRRPGWRPACRGAG